MEEQYDGATKKTDVTWGYVGRSSESDEKGRLAHLYTAPALLEKANQTQAPWTETQPREHTLRSWKGIRQRRNPWRPERCLILERSRLQGCRCRWDWCSQCDLKNRAKTKGGGEADFCSIGQKGNWIPGKVVKLYRIEMLSLGWDTLPGIQSSWDLWYL